MAEQLRDPLNLIRNFAHMLLEHHEVFDPKEIEQAAAAIEEQAELALRIIDEVGADAVTEVPGAPAAAVAEEAPAAGARRYGLSAREMDVLQRIARGLADKQIAAELGLSTFTVSRHVGAILTKMRAASRTEAGVRAVQEGMVWAWRQSMSLQLLINTTVAEACGNLVNICWRPRILYQAGRNHYDRAGALFETFET